MAGSLLLSCTECLLATRGHEPCERSERAKRSEPEGLKLHTRQALNLHTRQTLNLHTRQALKLH